VYFKAINLLGACCDTIMQVVVAPKYPVMATRFKAVPGWVSVQGYELHYGCVSLCRDLLYAQFN